jgi:NACHT domain- and WD repeat-containing protein
MSTNGDNSLRIWSLTREDEKYHVSHTDEITCFVITADSLHVITGSRDMSLKVWQATGGKLAQVSFDARRFCEAAPKTFFFRCLLGARWTF